MSDSRIDIATKVASEATESFLDAYYEAIHNDRPSLASYYVPKETLADGKSVPFIAWNGNVLDAESFQQAMVSDTGYMFHDAQSVDCHILNPNYPGSIASPSGANTDTNVSILVQVSGYVRLEEAREGPMRGFSETFTLVPNSGKGGGETQLTKGRKFLIQHQNFRFVV